MTNDKSSIQEVLEVLKKVGFVSAYHHF